MMAMQFQDGAWAHYEAIDIQQLPQAIYFNGDKSDQHAMRARQMAQTE